jgi:hypothetical protein
MEEERLEETRVRLMHDLRGAGCVCVWISELLGDLAEEGASEGGTSLQDALRASAQILKNLARTLDESERTLESWG